MIHEREQVRSYLSDLIDSSVATETQVMLGGGQARITRFSQNHIEEHLTEQHFRVWAKLAFRAGDRWRVGVSGTSDLSPEGLTRLLEVARSVADDRPVVDDYVELPWAEDYESTLVDTSAAFDPSTANAGPAFCAAEVAEIALPCRRLGYRCDGYHALVEGALPVDGAADFSAVGNNNGLFQYHLGTSAEVSATLTAPGGGVGVVAARATHASELNLPALLERAFADAELPRRGDGLAAGRYRVVLGAAAVGNLLDLLPRHLSQYAVDAELSAFSGQVGQSVFQNGIHLAADPTHHLLLRRAFDAEGWPRREVSLISDGVLESVLVSRAQARRAGATAHGYLALDCDPNIASAENLVLGGGEGTVDTLVSETEQAILIRRFPALCVVDPWSLQASGYIVRDAFVVVDGEIREALPHLHFRLDIAALFNSVVRLGTPEATRNHVAPPLVADGLEVLG